MDYCNSPSLKVTLYGLECSTIQPMCKPIACPAAYRDFQMSREPAPVYLRLTKLWYIIELHSTCLQISDKVPQGFAVIGW